MTASRKHVLDMLRRESKISEDYYWSEIEKIETELTDVGQDEVSWVKRLFTFLLASIGLLIVGVIIFIAAFFLLITMGGWSVEFGFWIAVIFVVGCGFYYVWTHHREGVESKAEKAKVLEEIKLEKKRITEFKQRDKEQKRREKALADERERRKKAWTDEREKRKDSILARMTSQQAINMSCDVEMTKAEEEVVNILKQSFRPGQIFVNVYVNKAQAHSNFGSYPELGLGKFTEVDVIVVSEQGILVIESKGFEGVVSGTVKDKSWFREAHGDKKAFSFANPIKQNEMHIQSLSAGLTNYFNSSLGEFSKEMPKVNLAEGYNPFISLIVFNDGIVFKEPLYPPDNCYILSLRRFSDVLRTLKESPQVFTASQIAEIYDALCDIQAKVTPELRTAHIKHVEKASGKERVWL